jgi:type IV pilus assembly protein PilM
MAKKLSLFVEDNNIKVLLCENELVVKWANLPLEAGLIINGVVTDEEKLAALIKQQFKFLQFDQKRVILGLSGLNSLYRIISLPRIPDNLLAEAVAHEAERMMPIAISDVYLSYQPIPGKAEERRIFLAAFPKAATDSLVKTLWRAGLHPYMMDLAPLALSRTVNLGRAVAVSAQGSNLDIVVMADKIPPVLRSLPLPGEAESITEKLTAIAEEVERTIAFYNQSQPENQLDEKVPVLVTGDLAQMKESWELLATRLGHPVEPLASPMQEPAGFDASQFMVNIGLILKESLREKGPDAALLINFNALPAIYRRTTISPINIAAPVVAVVALASVVIMGYTTMGVSSHVSLLEAEAANIQEQVTVQQAGVTALKTRIPQLEQQVKPLQDKTTLVTTKLTSLEASRTHADEYTSKIVSLLPEVTTLKAVNYAAKDITIQGTDEKLDDIYSYARDIRITDLFFVTITSIELKEAETTDETTTEPYYEFNFSLTIK